MQAALFDTWLQEAVREVLETMCFLPVDDAILPATEHEKPVCRRIDFSGPFTGSFGVYTTQAGAQLIACNLLGEDSSEVMPEQAADTLGEIGNMICGSILCRAESKQAFTLSHPADKNRDMDGAAMAHRSLRAYAIENCLLTTWLDVAGGL